MSLRFALCGLALVPTAVCSAPALDIDGLSPDVAACTDFDRHVNEKWQSSAPMPADKGWIENFTPEQRYFLSFATIWRSKYRTEALTDQLRTGSHSPSRYRVLGPLANVPAFARAFNCQAGAPMTRAPAEQISIW